MSRVRPKKRTNARKTGTHAIANEDLIGGEDTVPKLDGKRAGTLRPEALALPDAASLSDSEPVLETHERRNPGPNSGVVQLELEIERDKRRASDVRLQTERPAQDI